MGSWGYVIVGFVLTGASLAGYALRLQRRIARLRPRRERGAG